MKTKATKVRGPPLPTSLTIMAHDPGSVNYGFCLLRATRSPNQKKVRVTILENGMCPLSIKVLKSGSTLRQGLLAYKDWATALMRKYKVQFVVAERFMTRGGKGPTIEAINMMLGALLCGPTPCKVMPASQWKNAVTRAGVDLSSWYKWTKVSPHQFDACLIGVYMASTLYGNKGFDGLNLKAEMKGLALNAEATTKARLVNRKARA